MVPALRAALAELGAFDLVLAPTGLGGHVDHVQVLRALDGLDLGPVARWHDVPYALRLPEPPPGDEVEAAPVALARKLDACAAYRSQLGFQFGGEARMREALAALPERFGGETRALADALRPSVPPRS